MEQEDNRQWHLDKRVPIALILTLLLQTSGAVWWAAGLDSRLAHAEEKLSTYQVDRERLLKVEVYQENILKELKGIRSDLREISDKQHKQDLGITYNGN